MVSFDRFLFAFTIGSHIILVAMSISLILLIAVLEYFNIRKKDEINSQLIRRLKRVFIISFGVGTASGIVVAVELINLFPGFMTVVSETGIIGAFYLEIFAFFLETIALVIYVYFEGTFKWKYADFTLASITAFGTLLSGVLITMVNAWMNTPNGFYFNTANGMYAPGAGVVVTNVWAPLATVSTFSEIVHVLSTTVFAGTMLMGSYFAYRYIRSGNDSERGMFRSVLRKISGISIIGIVLAGITGSNEMATLLQYQPLKYAALDLNPTPGTGFSERLFGSISNGHVVGAIQIPGLQALLARVETGITQLPGLSSYPASVWPPLWTHDTFDIMVTGGLILGLFLFILFLFFAFRKDYVKYSAMLYLQVIFGFFAFFVYEDGWVTDEVGRQPWIIYNMMTVSQAANYSTSLLIPGYLIIAFYLIVIPSAFYFFARIFNSTPHSETSIPVQSGGVEH
ncbi:MAG: cytochrome ubiquinol oxidase subunit I [Thermoplasmata archaeon]